MSEGVQLEESTPNTSVLPFNLYPDVLLQTNNGSNPVQPTSPAFPTFLFLFLRIGFVIRVLVIPIACLGLVTNPINMAVFSKLLDNDTVSVSLFGMSLSDFLVCFTTLLGCIGEFEEVQKVLLYYLSINPREMVYLCVVFPSVHFVRVTLMISAFITLERCLCVAMPLKVKLIFTSRRCKIIMFFCFLIALSTAVPYYYTYIFTWTHYPPLNRSILGYTSKNGYKEIVKYSGPFVIIFFWVLFILIVICTGILIVVLNKKRNWRQSVTSTTTASKESNQVTSKELKVIKMMVMVASLFIVCNIPTSSIYIANEIDPSISMEGSKNYLYYLLGYFAILFQTFNSSVNIFIYYFYSTNYRVNFNKRFGIQEKEETKKPLETKDNS